MGSPDSLRNSSPVISVSDPTGRLTLHLDAAGRVQDMTLSALWRDSIPPDELASTVLRLLITNAPPPFTPRTPWTPDAPRLTAPQAEEVVEGFAALQAKLLAKLPTILSRASAGAELIKSRDGKVSIRVGLGRVVGIEANQDWLGTALRAGIVNSFTDGFARAYARIDDPDDDLADPLAPYAAAAAALETKLQAQLGR